MNDELHVVFGASGGIGNAVIRELHQQGIPVRGVNRSGAAIVPDGVEVVAADAGSADAVRRAASDATHIYQALFPSVSDAIIEVASDTGAVVILANNHYMYDPADGPMHEGSRHVYGDREGGRFYAEMASQVLDAHRNGRIRGTVGQASDVYGPAVRNGIGSDQVFGPLLAGKPANFLGDLDVVHTYNYADDVGHALVTLARDERSLGELWHLPAQEPITTRALFDALFEEMGMEPSLRVANGPLLSFLAFFSGQMRTLKREKVYQFVTPWLVDSSKYESVFGRRVTPFDEAVRSTVAWYREHLPAS